jgi:hypothetical protein
MNMSTDLYETVRGFMNMSTDLYETVLFVEAKYEHMLLWTFQIVGYLYITLFIYCLPGICSLNVVLYL